MSSDGYASKALKLKGFTLLELLVVISIIALMSSIILVAVSSAKDKAEVASVQQKMQQYRVALESYFLDYGTYPDPNNGMGPSIQYCLGHGPCYNYYVFNSMPESQPLIDALEPYSHGVPVVDNRIFLAQPNFLGDRNYYGGAWYRCTGAATDPNRCKTIQIDWVLPGNSTAICAPGTGALVQTNIVRCSQIIDDKKN